MLLLSPLFIPMTVSVMGLHRLSISMDFINQYISVAIIHTLITLPYFIVMIWYQYNRLGVKMQKQPVCLERIHGRFSSGLNGH